LQEPLTNALQFTATKSIRKMHIPKVAGINQSQLEKKSVKQKQRRDECKESDISRDDSCFGSNEVFLFSFCIRCTNATQA